MTNRILPSRIRIVGAQSERWPDRSTNTAWAALHDAVGEAREAVREADQLIAAIDEDADLTPAAKTRRKAELATALVEKVRASNALARARADVERNTDTLARRRPLKFDPPANAVEASLAAEIRSWLARQPSPAAAAFAHRNDPRVVAAVAHAPAFLSGLSPAEQERSVAAAKQALDPEGQGMIDALSQAVGVAESAVASAERLIGERGGLLRPLDEVLAAS